MWVAENLGSSCEYFPRTCAQLGERLTVSLDLLGGARTLECQHPAVLGNEWEGPTCELLERRHSSRGDYIRAARFLHNTRFLGSPSDNQYVQSVGLDELREVHRASKQRRSEEHTSELQSLMRISYAVFCLNKKIKTLSISRGTRSS